jgi:hypothetical protein
VDGAARARARSSVEHDHVAQIAVVSAADAYARDMRKLVMVIALVLVACVSESDATQSLQEDGYTDIKITGKGDDGFQFTAKDKTGASCTGTISIKKGMGSSSSQKTASCTAK